MAQFWQRQKIYAQVTALGALGGRWRSHHVRPRLRQIAPRNYAKQFRALQNGVLRWSSPGSAVSSASSAGNGTPPGCGRGRGAAAVRRPPGALVLGSPAGPGYDRDARHPPRGAVAGSGGDRGDGRPDGGGRLRDRRTVVHVHRGDDRGGAAGVRRSVPGRGRHQQRTDDGRLARGAGRDGVRGARVRCHRDGAGAAGDRHRGPGCHRHAGDDRPGRRSAAGTVSADRTSWTLGQNLAFGAAYTVTGTATGTDGRQVPITGTFGTAGTDTAIRNTVYPGDGAEVDDHRGDHPDDGAVATHVTLTSTPAVDGAWAW